MTHVSLKLLVLKTRQIDRLLACYQTAGKQQGSGAAMNLSVDVISSVICPWCFLSANDGLRRPSLPSNNPSQVRWLCTHAARPRVTE